MHRPDFIFISEPMLSQCDLDHEMKLFSHQYRALLCSEDSFDPELPLLRGRPKGGTMILWKINHHQFIKPLPTTSTAFLPILFSPPGLGLSIHVSLYLPTSGKEEAFIDAITSLSQMLEEILLSHPDAQLYIRGDANVNHKHYNRTRALLSFCQNLNLNRLSIDHPTYHHFMGHGLSDSELDVLLSSASANE